MLFKRLVDGGKSFDIGAVRAQERPFERPFEGRFAFGALGVEVCAGCGEDLEGFGVVLLAADVKRALFVLAGGAGLGAAGQ